MGEEVYELYPRVDDDVEFTGSKVTDIAWPVMEKRSQNTKFRKDPLKPEISVVDDPQAIYIEEFLEKKFATENMTHPGIDYIEDISNATEIKDSVLPELLYFL